VGGGNQCLFNRRAHAPAHFPEVGLEPGRFLKDRDQLGLARGRGIEIGEAVQVGSRLRRDLLVRPTGIFVDPDAIGVRCGARIGSRCQPCRDLRVADHAGSKRPPAAIPCHLRLFSNSARAKAAARSVCTRPLHSELTIYRCRRPKFEPTL
jgi:hypothetical protein